MIRQTEIKRIGDVCEVIAGQSPESKYYNNKGDGLPFYQGKKEFQEKYIGPPTVWTSKITKEAIAGDILMSVRAPVGPVNFSSDHMCMGRGLAAIRANKNIIKEYLFYFFLNHESKITGNTGAVFNSINKKQISQIEIPVPSVDGQQHIVSILDKAFAAIDQAKANVERNLENAKELFQSKLNEVFEQRGEGWNERRLGDICDYEKKRNEDSKLPYVGLEHIESDTGRFIGSFDPYEVKSTTFSFTEEHVLYGRLRPYLNKVLAPDFEGHCSTEIFPIKIKDNTVLLREFLFYWLISHKVMKKIDATWTGARMPRANMNEVLNFRIYIPPVSDQKTIDEKLRRTNELSQELINQYEKKMDHLNLLKKSILQKAFNGELNTDIQIQN